MVAMSRNQRDTEARKRHKASKQAERNAQIAQVQRERDIAEVFGSLTLWDRLFHYSLELPREVWDDKYEMWDENYEFPLGTLRRNEDAIVINGTRLYLNTDKYNTAFDRECRYYDESLNVPGNIVYSYEVLQYDDIELVIPFPEICVEFNEVCVGDDSGATGIYDWAVVITSLIPDDDPDDFSIGFEVIRFSEIPERHGGGHLGRNSDGLWLQTTIKGRLLEQCLNLLYEALRVLSLINLNNTELIDQPPNPRLSAISEREFGRPLTTYKVLKINTGHKEYYGRDKDTGLRDFDPRRMHVVRGHHAEYGTNGRKLLFGKYQRKIWIPAHVRGNEELGIVVKDYEVIASSD